ncbi:hypothetical protein QCA50_003284 [Cerrena zonata]|uniref:Peptide N-acetyl-beta-D-glucosaminyl asparaginase amidase A N-terminal domain-containing protein n=1 Tax=Cerrena zonata TaxID=2478898 RepID=A0AAW0GM45_9APHY
MLRQVLVLALGFVTLVRSAVLVDFQVAQPPPLPQDAKQCTVKILERTFGFSFGEPEIVQFTPPTECGEPGSWAGISLNFTVTSNGTQFDRLGIFTFQNVEFWRTSTPEPTRGDGIIWTYLKDATRYIPLFAKPGTFILQLDNLLQTGLDGQYAITTLANDTGNDASVPPIFSLEVTVPRNTVQIYAELQASGNGNEEFWYFNAPNQFVSTIPTFGEGPFREVRLLIDGQVAGVAFPYAVIFTGGIVPTAWRPITSYGALDLPTYFVDLTPFVPILTDGNPHNFSIDVVSAEADHTINQNWFVSGNLQVITDPSGEPTTGNITVLDVQPFAETTTTGTIAPNGDVSFTVKATRKIHVESTIISGSGKTSHVVWSQNLEYSNTQHYINNSAIQLLDQTATGTFTSTLDGASTLVDEFSYPLNINITNLNPSGTSCKLSLRPIPNHDLDLLLSSCHRHRPFIRPTSHPAPFILGSTIHNHQLSGGFFTIASTGNTGNGTSQNMFSYVDVAGNTYDREISSVNTNITSDHQGGTLAPKTVARFPSSQQPLTVAKARLPGGRLIGH